MLTLSGKKEEMLAREQVWTLLADLVACEGVELFDLDLPVGQRGILRVYIVPAGHQNVSVGIDECAAVSRRVLAASAVEDILPGDSQLEVSSPGINRRLRRREHFSGAVGERVRIKFEAKDGRKQVVKGLLQQFSGDQLLVQDEQLGELVTIPLGSVSEARVDFLFE